MRIYCYHDYQELSRHAANLLSAQIIMKPDSVIGLATGSTPIGIYDRLGELCRNGDLDCSKLHSVNLDEYIGLQPEHPQSYRYFMKTQLFDHINIPTENTNVPNGLETNLEAECARYDDLIDLLGGIDLQLLGMGNNGHVGFNEPGDSFTLGTHVEELSESTRLANARFFEDSSEQVPTHAFTMGIKNIMAARSVLIVVNGSKKAEMVKKAFFGPVTPLVPASILQLHPNVTLMGDQDAMKLLMEAGVKVEGSAVEV